jgi:hypothetical protein
MVTLEQSYLLASPLARFCQFKRRESMRPARLQHPLSRFTKMSGDSSLGIGIGLALKSYGRAFRGLLNQYPAAAAAYSLRKLSSAVSNVVRVRRASDNDEEDFTAEQIELGEMVNWVNSQTVPPLDIGVETSEGRIPVPEGGTSIGIPAAAYSLRNLSTTYTGNVVDVRRSSDDAEDSFTATEVADGTLTDWVGVGNDGFVTQWYDQSGNDNHATQGTDASQPKIVDAGVLVRGNTGEPAFTGDGVDDILSLSSSINFGTGEFFVSTVVDVDTGGVVIGSASPNWMLLVTTSSIQVRASNTNVIYIISPDSVLTAGESYLISLSRVGNDITAYVNGVAQADVETVVSTDTFSADRFLQRGTNGNPYPDPVSEVIIYNSDQSANRTAIEANIGETYGITGIPAYDNTVDGFVETWYDQSGNGNDATQATAGSQPKIVSNGSLVTGGIVFDTGKTLAKTGLSISSPLNTFVVSTADTEHNGAILKLSNSSQQYRTDRKLLLQYPDLLFTGSNVYTVGEQNLQSFQFVAGTSVGFFNGTQVLSGTTAGETVTEFRLGNTGSFGLDGKINEAIIYNSDQSANRVAIETNINDHYNIY